MRTAIRIALKDLKLRLRDRSVFIIGVIAPLVLAVIFNFVFGGAFDPTEGLGLEYGLVDLDRSDVSAAFSGVLGEIEDQGIIELTSFDDAESANAAVEAGEIDAYFFLDTGFGEAISGGAAAAIEVIGSIDSPTATQIAASVAEQYGHGVEAAQLAVATSAALSGEAPTLEYFLSLTGDPATAAFSFSLEDVAAATRQLDATTYFSAGMAVFFLFFTVQFGVLGLLEEERQGTMQRLLASPISRAAIVWSKAILAFALGLLSMTVLVVSTQLLIGATWGSALGVALLVSSGVFAAVGIMGMVASVARTPEGAGNLGAIIAVILGLLGGVFFQVGQGDDLLSKLTLITPHAWFMRGLADLADGAHWTAALPAVSAILAFAVVTGVLSWIFLRRRLVR